jgi:hypothetical protein
MHDTSIHASSATARDNNIDNNIIDNTMPVTGGPASTYKNQRTKY